MLQSIDRNHTFVSKKTFDLIQLPNIYFLLIYYSILAIYYPKTETKRYTK